MQLHMPGDPHSIWLRNATTCNPVTLWKVFVNVQLHRRVDPQSVLLGHATTASNSTTLIKCSCLILIGTVTVLCQVCGQTDASVSSFILPCPVKTELSTAWTAPFPVCATAAENWRPDLSDHTSVAWYLLHSRLVCILLSASFGQTFLVFFRIMYMTVAKLIAWHELFSLCINRIETVCLKNCVNRIETVCPKICVQQLVLYCCFQGMLWFATCL